MTLRRVLITVVGVLTLTAGPLAQTTTKTTEPAGTAKVTTTQMTGEVVQVDGNNLLVRMQPGGQYRTFNVQPTRQFMIDGQPKTVKDLTPGTTLTATVTTTAQPVTDRTTTVTDATVWFVDSNTNHLIVTLPTGENKSYDVPPGFKFTVDGKPATLQDLRKGMKVSGTKITSQPRTELSTATVVTGKSSK
jgi:hypothetical protein